jgi:hypothetical protein
MVSIESEQAWEERRRSLGMIRFGTGPEGKSWGTRWLVLEDLGMGNSHRRVRVLCKCGTESIIDLTSVKIGKTKSCGCYKLDLLTTHGGCADDSPDHRLYNIWVGMLHRCDNPRSHAYSNYGGRGISICPEWMNFTAFRNWARSHGYEDDLTIERIDNELGYFPGNCTWIPKADQGRHRRNIQMVTAFDEAKYATQWAEDSRCIVNFATLFWRLRKGWDPEKALTTPARVAGPDSSCSPGFLEEPLTAFGETKPVRDWLRDPRCVPQGETLRSRLHRLGWSAEEALTTPLHRRVTD